METDLKIVRNEYGRSIGVEIKDFPIFVKKTESKNWIAYCPQFKTFGKSKKNDETAVQNLYASLDIFFEVHLTRGTLEAALEHLNFIPTYKPKQHVSYSKPSVGNIPSVKAGLLAKQTSYNKTLALAC